MGTPQGRNPVLLVTADAGLSHAVTAALAANGHFVNRHTCHDLRQLLEQLEQTPSLGVLIDLDPDPAGILANLDAIINRFNESRFIVLSRDYRPDWVRGAMKIGVRDYLLKQVIDTELCTTLDRLYPQAAHSAQATVLSVMGTSGGCGATTIAINLANELHLQQSRNVLLVDMDYALGGVGTCLGLEGQYGLDDVLSRRDRIDAELITSTSVPLSSGVRVLLSPASTQTVPVSRPTVENLDKVLEACRRACPYVVLDAPRLMPEEARQLALASHLCFLVVQLSVKDLRMANRLLLTMLATDVPRSRFVILVNRFRRRSMVTLKEVGELFRDLEIRLVRNDYKGVIRGLNFGQTLAQAAPRSKARRDVQELLPLVNAIQVRSQRA